ncbi:LiaF transmembrane domain-containing protein [Deminuibacter soli]|uniref:LiaF transmembrane domain-containing protein n=1 Tax=Deminuibacter soli TaxID=2291815 RepID=A0A3E1NH14_9BACT|nr:hypothetical protein [Deminuibacter soli]RFM27240.1 hypothetical protein DXN05_14490 [Deminuibacter soli]
MSRFHTNRIQRNHRPVIGLVLVAAGFILFASKFFTGIPAWLVSWPMFAVAAGLAIALANRFRNPVWVFPFFWGVYGVLNMQMPGWNLHEYVWPAAIMITGFFLMSRYNGGRYYKREWKAQEVDITAVFSNNKAVVATDDFKGGDVTCFMGGASIDLRNAGLQSPATLDITCFMGGCKLLLPADWIIKSDLTAIMGGIDDKRTLVDADPTQNKVLVIDGTAFMGGIEITSF